MHQTNWFTALLFGILLVSQILPEALGQNSDEEAEAEIRLYYYPNVQNSSEKLLLDLAEPSSFQDGRIIKDKRAKIMIHGANGWCSATSFPIEPINAYLKVKASGKEDYNVFCLDYQNIAKVPWSGIPGNRLPNSKQWFEYVADIVGNKTARYILALEENGIVPSLEQVHIVGHSLGGQVTGVAGRKIREMTDFQRKLGRITGLDVMNLFNFNVYSDEVNLQYQIDSSDATFVDIIHANDGQIGLRGDYGQVDFYPDGGEHQKSCLQQSPIENWLELITGYCSHNKVGQYWADSVEHGTVKFCKANSYDDYTTKKNTSDCSQENMITFGEYIPQSAFGKFYMDMD